MSPLKHRKEAQRDFSTKIDWVHDFLVIPNDVSLLPCSTITPGLFGWSHLGSFKKIWKTALQKLEVSLLSVRINTFTAQSVTVELKCCPGNIRGGEQWHFGTRKERYLEIFKIEPIENSSHGTEKGYPHFSSLRRNNTVIKNRLQSTGLFIHYRWTELAVG